MNINVYIRIFAITTDTCVSTVTALQTVAAKPIKMILRTFTASFEIAATAKYIYNHQQPFTPQTERSFTL
jgi:hypothetical protein